MHDGKLMCYAIITINLLLFVIDYFGNSNDKYLGLQSRKEADLRSIWRDLRDHRSRNIAKIRNEGFAQSLLVQSRSFPIQTETMKEARLEGLFLELLDHPGIIKLH